MNTTTMKQKQQQHHHSNEGSKKHKKPAANKAQCDPLATNALKQAAELMKKEFDYTSMLVDVSNLCEPARMEKFGLLGEWTLVASEIASVAQDRDVGKFPLFWYYDERAGSPDEMKKKYGSRYCDFYERDPTKPLLRFIKSENFLAYYSNHPFKEQRDRTVKRMIERVKSAKSRTEFCIMVNTHKNIFVRIVQILSDGLTSCLDEAYDGDNVYCGNCCKQLTKKLNCSRCKSAFYCNAECQKANWAKHKKDCSEIVESDAQGTVESFRKVLSTSFNKKM